MIQGKFVTRKVLRIHCLRISIHLVTMCLKRMATAVWTDLEERLSEIDRELRVSDAFIQSLFHSTANVHINHEFASFRAGTCAFVDEVDNVARREPVKAIEQQ